MGLLNTIAEWFKTEELSPPSHHSIFQNWMQQLASVCGGHLRWDRDGDAEMTVYLRGEPRCVLTLLRNGTLYVFVPSNIKFRAGGLPGDMAAFLADRNRKLDYADWDAIDNGQHSYFTLRVHGRMERIDLDMLRTVIVKMLAEASALDQTLEEQGYVR